jgi:hypothetical protein
MRLITRVKNIEHALAEILARLSSCEGGAPVAGKLDPIPQCVWETLASLQYDKRQAFAVSMDWDRYLVVDPGYCLGTAYFLAVTPGGETAIVYNSFSVQNCDAKQWAARVRNESCDMASSGVPFKAMFIDRHAGPRCPCGNSISIAALYREALLSQLIPTTLRGPIDGFFPWDVPLAKREES